MHRNILRALPRSAPRPSAFTAARSLHVSSSAQASKPAHEPASTQGHATKKARDPITKNSNVQSAAAGKGMSEKHDAAANPSGEDQPFDAARQANEGGETKGGGRSSGPFKDQNGGQDEEHKGPGALKGDASTAASGGMAETLTNKVKGGFETLKNMRTDQRNFSTSARSSDGTTPRADPKGAREPVEKEVHGDQNPHLKHTEGGSQGKAATGNAAADPSLPSKKSTKTEKKPAQTRSFSTSLRALADPNTPSGDAPIHGQKVAQQQSGLKSQPRGDDVEHGGAAGAPSQGSQGAPEGTPNPASGTAAPDPGLSKGEQQTAKKANQTRSFSTSARALADPNTPSGDAPISAQKDAQSQSGLRQQPRGAGVEHGGAAGAPSLGSKAAPEGTPNAADGTSAPDPGLSKEEKGGAKRDGMGVRNFSTSTRVYASPGYAKTHEPEAKKAGYEAPPTALPSGLKSAYEEKDAKATQRPDPQLKASSQTAHSSTAVDPPNEALRKAALDGTLGERNPQPDRPGNPTGPQGIDEGWKHRK